MNMEDHFLTCFIKWYKKMPLLASIVRVLKANPIILALLAPPFLVLAPMEYNSLC